MSKDAKKKAAPKKAAKAAPAKMKKKPAHVAKAAPQAHAHHKENFMTRFLKKKEADMNERHENGEHHGHHDGHMSQFHDHPQGFSRVNLPRRKSAS